MKLINASFEVKNDLEEYTIISTLEGLGGKFIKVLPNTDHLKDDPVFKELYKEETKAKNAKLNYTNKHRI